MGWTAAGAEHSGHGVPEGLLPWSCPAGAVLVLPSWQVSSVCEAGLWTSSTANVKQRQNSLFPCLSYSEQVSVDCTQGSVADSGGFVTLFEKHRCDSGFSQGREQGTSAQAAQVCPTPQPRWSLPVVSLASQGFPGYTAFQMNTVGSRPISRKQRLQLLSEPPAAAPSCPQYRSQTFSPQGHRNRWPAAAGGGLLSQVRIPFNLRDVCGCGKRPRELHSNRIPSFKSKSLIKQLC